MNKGIYIALSGALLKHSQMDVIAQNLANASTAGYKKDKISFRDYLINKDAITNQTDGRSMSQISSFRTDFSAGDIVKTGNSLDIALDGDGFIALEGKRYTRRGDLKRDKEGYLTTYNGIKVLGNSGPVRLHDGIVEINVSGDVAVNGTVIDSLKLTDFPKSDDLSKVSDGIYFTQSSGIKAGASVRQSCLETSNVDVIREMVGMIDTLREFESFQKAIQIFDKASELINNELGRL